MAGVTLANRLRVDASGAGVVAFALLLTAGAVAACVTVRPWVILYGLLLTLLLVPMALDLLKGRFDLFAAHNVFAAYFFLDFGLGIINDVVLGQRETVDRAEFMAMLPTALACANLSLLLFYLGYYLPLGPALAARCRRLRSDWKSSRVNLVVATSMAVGILAYLGLLEAKGGLSNFLMGQQQLGANETGVYYLLMLSFRLPLLATMVCFLWARSTIDRRYTIAAACIAAITFIIGGLSGARGMPLRTLIALLACAYYVRPAQSLSKLVKILLASAGVIALTMVLMVETAVRDFGYVPGLSAVDVVEQAGTKTLTVSHFESFITEFVSRFMAYEELERVLERTGKSVTPQDGKTFLEAFWGVVPRALWPGKPAGVAAVAGDLFLDHTATAQIFWFPTLTWPGELYWNFFLPGVVVGMILSGVFCRFVYAYLLLNPNLSGVLLYIPMLLFFQVFVIGGLGAVIIETMMLVIPTTAAYFVLTR